MVFVGIIGPGLVGREVISQIRVFQTVRKNNPIEINVLGICSSKQAIITQSPSSSIPLDKWLANPQELTTSKQYTLIQSSSAITPSFVDSLQKLARTAKDNSLVIVDCTASGDVATLYPDWLSRGISVVTPNKKAFSSDISLWTEIQRLSNPSPPANQHGYPLCYHESSVGAGLPVISTIKDLILTGDKIRKIEGVFSGTLSFLFNTFGLDSNRKSFAQIVAEAKEMGYTEPDPRDDLNGVDVARKVVILARLIGMQVSLLDEGNVIPVEIENIVPVELQSIQSPEEFMERLPEFNSQFENMKSEAAGNGQVLRYVGVIDTTAATPQCQVKIEKYKKDHPFAQLKGTDNIIAIHTDRFTQPLIVQGAGAGAAVTAHGVLSDLIKVGQILDYHQK